MKHIDEFRSVELAKTLVKKLLETVERPVRIMEVCGTHTASIFRNGIRDILRGKISFVSGPGCPVCVTPQGYIDEAVRLARQKNVIMGTFGDMLRVPGNQGSLLQEKSAGSDIRILYSPLDAVEIAANNPGKKVVFLGVGFETTAPVVGLSILEAAGRSLGNYTVFSAHKLVPPAMEALAGDPELQLDGFLCPGHVCTVTGLKPFRFLAEKHGKPAVIAGFEIVDILHGLLALAEMIRQGKPAVVNKYRRAVPDAGNPAAIEILDRVFSTGASAWRGMGVIPQSGLEIRQEFSLFDASRLFGLGVTDRPSPAGCICGDIMRGRRTPLDCLLYKNSCTPENPVGACMVSAEGTCAAYHKYCVE